jgi:hypothetical protein
MKSHESLIQVASLRAEIWTRNTQNAKQECWAFERDGLLWLSQSQYYIDNSHRLIQNVSHFYLFNFRLNFCFSSLTDHTQPCRVRTAPSSFLHDVPGSWDCSASGTSFDSFSGRVLIGGESGTGDYHF